MICHLFSNPLEQLPKTTPTHSPSLSPSLTPTLHILLDSISDEAPASSLNSAAAPAAVGLAIQRPHSALHTGNFSADAIHPHPNPQLSAPSPGSWNGVAGSSQPIGLEPLQTNAFPTRRRSSVYRNSLVFMPPTSPLAQSASPDDIVDRLPLSLGQIALSGPMASKSGQSPELRRSSFSHTMSSSRSVHIQWLRSPADEKGSGLSLSASVGASSVFMDPVASLRQTPLSLSPPFPHRHHNHSINHSLSHSHYPSSRRLSSTDHAPLVGSYEESLLRGRMSTVPSRPLTFNAQIGVLGRGNCKPSLRCPAHVTLPFHAVFYDYPSKARDSRGAGAGSGGIADDGGPSPYVGTVDLENSLLAYGAQSQQKTGDQRRKKPKAHSEDTATRAPPGGSYRIPEVGQLQIIIKNPHKTAIKLFLVPYDLTGMQPGTKTFVRQRCYSLGPPASPIAPGGSGQASGPPQAHNRPVLRYLVHANICCPAKGRFYLYKDLRLVFANRVPDSHEKLRTEMTSPEPRFSAYRPTRSSALGTVRSTKARHGRTRSYGDVLQTLTRLGDGGGDHGVDMRSPQDAHLGSKTYADAVESPSETSPSILPEASKTWEYQKLSLDKVSSRVSSPAPQSLLSWGLWSMNSVQGEEDKKEKVDNAPA
ncbi:Protein FAM214A [Ceratocystis lukuohia]|uniref:Protein FAM214A n=1 Tax=Ceratocystis lukuohia TaxID=2019550 RepID=A0ABR4MCQ8_9PEZI